MMISCSLRLIVRSPVRKLVLASCCVSVDPPCADAAGLGVAEQRAGDALRVDPPVRIEAPVLDRDDRGGDVFRQLGDRDRRLLIVAAPRDRVAGGVEQDEARVLQRLERAAERGGDDQPDAERDERERR